jgi:serine-type D-Ala-D-Ala carboxypeptidase/endopeptidase (penicillin-binding protein 4)
MEARAVRKRAAGTLAVLALLSGCGGGGGTTSSSSATDGSSQRHRAGPTRPHVPAALTRLRRELAHTLALAGASSGASVYDLTDRASVFSARAQVKRPPASVEKLYTTVALLTRMGPNARLHTSVLGTGHLGPGGVWHGNLYLHGDGDPTFGDGAFNRTWEFGYGPTAAQLVAQLTGRGIRRVSGQVIGDASLFDGGRGGLLSGLAADIPDFGGQLSALTYDHGATSGALSPGAFAARQLMRSLRAAKVQARAATTTDVTPRHARLLAVVSSPRLATLLALMNVPSDDLFAELLTKQLGVRFGGKGTIAAGAHVISRTIAGYGLHPKILDGSGLSRDDRSSPAEVVALLRTVWRTNVGHVLSRSLPVLGLNGTVRRIGVNTPAQGHCIAKTGTLNNVTNLAGYCRTGQRHMLAFAILLEGPSNERGLVLLSRMTAAIARY